MSVKQTTNPEMIKKVMGVYLGEDKPTLEQTVELCNSSHHVVSRIVSQALTKEEYDYEKKLRYSRSKLGDKNPMLGKMREQHHSYKGVISDGKGYSIALRPSWYTGRASKHIFYHHIVMCEALGITRIPEGFHVHHINGIKTDNRIENLALVSKSGHAEIHQFTPVSERSNMWEYYQFLIWKSKQTNAS